LDGENQMELAKGDRLILLFENDKKIDIVFCQVVIHTFLKETKFRTKRLIHHSDRGVQYCSYQYNRQTIETRY